MPSLPAHVGRVLLPLAGLAAVFAVPAPAAAPAASLAATTTLDTGLMDPQVEFSRNPTDLQTSAKRLTEAGGRYWRFQLSWRAVAPTKPPTTADAQNPGWSGYDWATTDQVVRSIAAGGAAPLPFFLSAPDWAEGPGRPTAKTAPVGSWRPDPTALGAFATAAARRYSGGFDDPLNPGGKLPRIAAWQIWNEPNLSNYLGPQWLKTGTSYSPNGPALYRRLLNAGFDGIKRADRSLTVVTAGTAPFGDLRPGDPRIAPRLFWRELLCVTGRAKLRAKSCQKSKFDVYAHHPYPIGPPNRRARNADDVSVPDLAKISGIVEAARKKGTVSPNRSKPLWVTEISWDSAPDPDGLSLAEHAIYLEGALNVLWKQKAKVVIWFNIRDQAPTPSFAATYQSGLYARGATVADDMPKPALTAFSFPFTAYRTNGVSQIWGKAPLPGTVEIELRTSAGWTRVATVTAGSNRMFSGRARVGRGTQLRAVSGNATSLVWTTS